MKGVWTSPVFYLFSHIHSDPDCPLFLSTGPENPPLFSPETLVTCGSLWWGERCASGAEALFSLQLFDEALMVQLVVIKHKPRFHWHGTGRVGSGAFPPKNVWSVPKKCTSSGTPQPEVPSESSVPLWEERSSTLQAADWTIDNPHPRENEKQK